MGSLVVLVLAVFLALAALVARNAIVDALERRRVASAGISTARPGCAGCLYPLGGWSSSHCPECGSDVETLGVRIGPKAVHRGFVGLTWGLLAFMGLPVSIGLASWLLRIQSQSVHRLMVPADEAPYEVRFQSTTRKAVLPLLEVSSFRLEVIARAGGSNKPVGEWSGSSFASLPNSGDLARVLTEAGAGPDDTLVRERATDVLARVQGSGFNRVYGARLTAPPTILWASGGNTDASDNRLEVILVSAVVHIVGSIVIIRKRLRREDVPHWRLPVPDEWNARVVRSPQACNNPPECLVAPDSS